MGPEVGGVDKEEETSKTSKQMGDTGELEEDVVTPWNVTASSALGVDYDKLISEWRKIRAVFNVRF